MVESGYDGFVTASINFLVAPPGTPLPIRQQLGEAATRALDSAQVQQAFAQMGAKAVPATPDQLAAYIAEQQQRWTQIVATTHISAE
jgi:tripartite-type tricarboxylate transporter receptor subunit TctC